MPRNSARTSAEPQAFPRCTLIPYRSARDARATLHRIQQRRAKLAKRPKRPKRTTESECIVYHCPVCGQYHLSRRPA
jgi:rubrerythrin